MIKVMVICVARKPKRSQVAFTKLGFLPEQNLRVQYQYQGNGTVWFQKISIPPPQRVTEVSSGGGV